VAWEAVYVLVRGEQGEEALDEGLQRSSDGPTRDLGCGHRLENTVSAT
jgi:hypothetical protein